MKKINYLLITITLIWASLIIFSELDKGIVIILKDSSIVLTILFPYILKKFFKININENLIFIWILFIFMAHFLGVICHYYNKYLFFDKVAHTFSGVLSGSVGVLLVNKVKSKDILFNVLFILSFTWFCAGMWEVFEFICNYFFGGDAQMVAATGVSDTMWDMIVAFIGSIFVSIIYYLKRC